jgi:hypothetical protein
MMDRTDEIRSALRRARMAGSAAKLRHAFNLLERDESATVARAIVGDVLRDLEPPVTASRLASEDSVPPTLDA